MSWRNRVIWSEGLFLRPQHFQQQIRYLEQFVEGQRWFAFELVHQFRYAVVDRYTIGRKIESVFRSEVFEDILKCIDQFEQPDFYQFILRFQYLIGLRLPNCNLCTFDTSILVKASDLTGA